MKNIKYFLLPLLLLTASLFHNNSFAAPSTKEFTVDGIKIILKPSVKDVISVRLFIEGGTGNYPKDKEGIEALAYYMAVYGGTTTLPKVEFNAELEKIGTTLQSNAAYDYGEMNMTCVKMFWDRSWELFADAVMNPAFSEAEFNITKEQLIANAKQNLADPDARLRNQALANVFKGKNYAKIPGGTPESIAKLTLSDVRDYFKTMVSRKKAFLVVVGNITEEDLTAKVQSTLSKLPEGTPPAKENRTFITEPAANIEDRDIATNYIRGLLAAPPQGDEEAPAMQLAMSILSDRFFTELRTKRSLSYAPSAFYSTGAIHNPYNVIYISSVDPKTSMQVMVDIINDVKQNGFTPEELKNKKEKFLTFHYLGLETNGAQSNNLGTSEIAGDWSLSESFNDRVGQVDLKKLNTVFNKYANVINWTYLGDKTLVKPEDFKQIKKNEKEVP